MTSTVAFASAWTFAAGMLSTPADFTFFSTLTSTSTLSGV